MVGPVLLAVLRMSVAVGEGDFAPGRVAPALSVDEWVQRVSPLEGRDAVAPGVFAAARVTLIEFWATWCPPCVGGMEDLSAFAEAQRPRGIDVLALTDEDRAIVERFLQRKTPAGRLQSERFRTTLGCDPDGSTLAALLPAEFRNFRPFAVIVGPDGRVEWLGSDMKRAKEVALAVRDRKWDRDAFAAAWAAQLKDQRERDRIQTEEDWSAAQQKYWNDADFLAKIAFRIAFNFGGQLRNPDLGTAATFAERAVELTQSRRAYELSVLAQVRYVQKRPGEAAALQRRACALLGPDEDRTFFESNLARYEEAAATDRP